MNSFQYKGREVTSESANRVYASVAGRRLRWEGILRDRNTKHDVWHCNHVHRVQGEAMTCAERQWEKQLIDAEEAAI